MSSLLYAVSSKFRATSKITNGGTMMFRSLAPGTINNNVVNTEPTTTDRIGRFQTVGTGMQEVSVGLALRTNFIERILQIYSNKRRNFAALSSVTKSTIKANVDSNNILSSPFKDIEKFDGIYVHEIVFRCLDRWPDKTAAVCSITGRSYTYARMRKLVGRLATSLRMSNLRPGDTIAAILPNIPEYGILVLAVSEAGLRITLINPAYTSNEIRNQLENSNASAIFTTTTKHSLVASCIADNPNVKLPIVVIDDGKGVAATEGTIKFEDLIRDDIEEFEKTGEKIGVDSEDTFLLPYSSGTSGLPKGVELSHRNFVANILQLLSEDIAVAKQTTASHQEILPFILPLYHVYGVSVALVLHALGGKLVCLPHFTPENFFKLLEENRSTLLYLAPPVIQMLANDERFKKRHWETMRIIVSGAAPIGDEALANFYSRTSPNLKVVQGYGTTECSPAITMGSKTPSNSVGHVMPNTKIRIVGYEAENEGKNLGYNEVGEVYVNGPQVMKGYYKNPEATANTMENDWLKTGDLACYDESGLMYIRGRLKELIKVQGYQVAPAELEDLIQGHEKVADAAVIGVAHEKYGEIPKAFVVPKKGVTIEPNEIMKWTAERVTKYKRLGQVQFIKQIPKSAAGKILRRELQKL